MNKIPPLIKWVTILGVFLIFTGSVQANGLWKAKWIIANHCQNTTNTWSCFHKQVMLDTIPVTAIAKIAVDTKYWLWINEKQVIFEGGLKRGPNPRDTYYDEIDIAPFLEKGKNTIAVLTWYMGKEGFSHISSGKAGFFFECLAPGMEILSDKSWKGIIHLAYETCGYPFPNFRLAESSIRFNARRDFGFWQGKEFNATDWRAVEEYGTPPVTPWNELVPRPILQWKNSGLIDYINIDSIPAENAGDSIICHLPANIHITPYLKIDAPEGLTIDIRTDFFNGGGEPNVRAEYVTKKGVQAYESLGWMNGQKVIYLIPTGIKILELKYRETGFNTDFAGRFSCSDKFLEHLWIKARRTLYVTMRDNYMDCPDRERAQWWGDAVNESGEAFYALDINSHSLCKKGMYELIGWQRPDGTLFSPIPASNWNQELPCQMLASIGYYGFWNYYLHTGDRQSIADLYDGVRKYLDVWKLKADGSLVYRQGEWPWGDWGDHVDIELIENSWYYLALKGFRNMAEILGKTADVQSCEHQMELFKIAYNAVFWSDKEYRHPEYKMKTDDRAQGLAVVSGLAGKEKYPAIFEVFKAEEHASPFMEKYVEEALFVMGQEDYALQRMKKRFGEMVNHPDYTTLFEGWGIGSKGFGGGTANHAWSGGGLTLLSQYLCGITPLEAGYAKFQVRPQPGNIKHASIIIKSVKGIICSSFESEDARFGLNVSVPETTTALVNIPVKGVTRIFLNGITVWKNGGFSGNKNILSYTTDEKYIIFEVAAGEWKFLSEKS